ncbi:MAG: 2-C-methyl-D-erythritol 4-phosphate cytidylyltransferase [Deltaproteobacteria bacterium]|jgi:2-C-methyl-D-erythritol 4-phosphate cytidylyltransferase|nr:2-C-methyl-D-erythritol 4-phosphate cytidylyltransferase [Deltaproteobacteria bacterium]
MKVTAVIVSAGIGQRFMDGKKKQFLPLAGKPVLAHTLDPFERCPLVNAVVLVVGQEDMDFCLKEIVEKYQYKKISRIVPGGKTRQESVKNGVGAVPEDVEMVVIHDGVRPFVTREMIEESVRSAIRFQAVVVATPVKDTIKTVDAGGSIRETLDRNSLWQVQTPQTFRTRIIRDALRKAAEDGFLGTDDASLVERMGINVHVVQGSYANIKITTPEDLLLATFLLQANNPNQGEDE